MERRKSSRQDYHVLLKHLHYFGVEPLRLRAAAARIVARVAGLPPERARVTSRQLLMDFGIDTSEGLVAGRRARCGRPARAAHRASRRVPRRSALRRNRRGARCRPAAARTGATTRRRRLHARRADQRRMGAHPARNRIDRAVRQLHEPRPAARGAFARRSSCVRVPRHGARIGAPRARPKERTRSASRFATSTRSSRSASSPACRTCRVHSASCSRGSTRVMRADAR